MITHKSSSKEWAKAVADFIALEKEIATYNNGMFVTVNYFIGCGENEHSAFKLILKRDKSRKHWFHGWQKKHSVHIEYGLHEVDACRKTWLKIRDQEFKQEWETPW